MFWCASWRSTVWGPPTSCGKLVQVLRQTSCPYQKNACASDLDFSTTLCRKAIFLLLSSQCCHVSHVSCHKMQVVFFVKFVKQISLESWIPHLWHRCGRVNHRLLKCCSGATAALCQLGKVWQSAADLRDQPWCNATIQRPGRAVSGSLWIKNAIHLLCHTTLHDRHAHDCLCQTQVFFCLLKKNNVKIISPATGNATTASRGC